MQESEGTSGQGHVGKNLEPDLGGQHWLLRHFSAQLFFSSSVIVLVAWTIVYSLYLLHRIGWLVYPNDSEWLVALCIAIAIFAVPASLYLLVGMLWYWVKFDDSRPLAKGVWLLSFVTLAWLAAAAYYFAIYRRRFSSSSQEPHPL